MINKKKLILIIFIIIIFIVGVVILLSSKNLSKVIPTDNIMTIKIEDLAGQYNEETEEYEELISELSEEEKIDFINEIKDGKYKKRIFNIKATSRYVCHIYYNDGTRIRLDDYQVIKYDKNDKIIDSKKIYLYINIDEYM